MSLRYLSDAMQEWRMVECNVIVRSKSDSRILERMQAHPGLVKSPRACISPQMTKYPNPPADGDASGHLKSKTYIHAGAHGDMLSGMPRDRQSKIACWIKSTRCRRRVTCPPLPSRRVSRLSTMIGEAEAIPIGRTHTTDDGTGLLPLAEYCKPRLSSQASGTHESR